VGNTHCLCRGPTGPPGNTRVGAGPQKWNRPAGPFENKEPPRPKKWVIFQKWTRPVPRMGKNRGPAGLYPPRGHPTDNGYYHPVSGAPFSLPS
jgi:hypothetical protein